MKHSRYLPAISIAMVASAPLPAQWIVDAGGHYEFDDNITLAQLRHDIKRDNAFRANLSGGQFFQLTPATSLAITADFGGTTYLRYDGLNNVSLGASTSLRHKFGLGPAAFWIRLGASTAHHDFEHDQRDGWRHQFSFGLGKRLSDRLELRIQYLYELRLSDQIKSINNANHHEHEEEEVEDYSNVSNSQYTLNLPSDAFNQEAHSVSLTGIYTITDRLTTYFGYTRREGDVTSTTLRNLPIFLAADAIAADSAFGTNTFAYRIYASTDIFNIGLSWALSGHSSINLGYERRHSDSSHGLQYDNNIAHLDLLYSY